MSEMWKKLKSALNLDRPPELTTLFSAPGPEPRSDYERAFAAPPVCYSEKFPQVPKPAARTLPELFAARWAAGDVRPEQTPVIAADMLELGLDTPSMRRLAGEMHVRCRSDVEDLVVKMLNELGVKAPDSETEAKMVSTSQIAREVIAGMRNAWRAVSELERIWGYEIWHHKYLCDIAQLADEVHWDPPGGQRFLTLAEELVETFAVLGARDASKERDPS